MDNLDQSLVNKTKPEESISLGFSFHFMARVVGVALCFVGIVMLTNFHILVLLIGIAILLTGLFLISSSYGVQLDYTNKMVREYSSFIGIKTGEWIDMDKFPYVSIMLANNSLRSSDITGVNTVTVTDEAYGIYLLNKTHRKKILIDRPKGNSEYIKMKAQEFAEKTNKELVKYSPARISRTR